jgi:hypothetical protein
MLTRSIEAKRVFPRLALVTVAMLAVTLATPGAAQAKEGPVADAPAEPAMLVAASQRIDPTSVGTDRDKGTSPLEDGREQSATVSSRSGDVTSDQVTASLIVDANLPDREPGEWDSFRRSLASAATSSCFGPDALSHQEFAAEGLLRLPFLVGAAADGACR